MICGCLATALFALPALPTLADSRTDETDSSQVSSYEGAFAEASDLGDGMIDLSSEELSDLLNATDVSENGALVITGEGSQVLGFAENPSPAHDQALFELIEPMLSAHPEITVGEFDLLARDFDLNTVLIELAKKRVDTVEESIRAMDSRVEELNHRARSINTAFEALILYRKSPNAAKYQEAQQAILAANVTPPLAGGLSQAEALVAVLNMQVKLEEARNDNTTTLQMEALKLQSALGKLSAESELVSITRKRMMEERSTVVGSMRSTPVFLGSVEWNLGEVSGVFDLSDVPDGEHHLIIDFADAGVTLVANVTFSRGSTVSNTAWMWPVGGVLLLVILSVGGYAVWRRGAPKAAVSTSAKDQ